MAGSLVDLSAPGASIPPVIAVDTNVVASLLLAAFFPRIQSPADRDDSQRAVQLIQNLQSVNGIGVVTPTAYVELVHVLVKGRYKHEIYTTSPLTMIQRYGKKFGSWELLYKADPTLLQGFRPQLTTLKQIFTANGLVFVGPESLDLIQSGRTFDDEMIELTTRYGMNSGDIRILIEAQCFGLVDIVTFDKDLQRATADFNVYTWL